MSILEEMLYCCRCGRPNPEGSTTTCKKCLKEIEDGISVTGKKIQANK